jgi:hypothetical protein
MMNIFSHFRSLTLFVLILTTACSSMQTGRQPSLVSASGPNLATVYLYRTHDSFIMQTPGQHVFTATTDTTSTQNFKLQAGATYYVKASVVSSQHLYHPSLSVVFDLQGQAAIQNLNRLYYHE